MTGLVPELQIPPLSTSCLVPEMIRPDPDPLLLVIRQDGLVYSGFSGTVFPIRVQGEPELVIVDPGNDQNTTATHARIMKLHRFRWQPKLGQREIEIAILW